MNKSCCHSKYLLACGHANKYLPSLLYALLVTCGSQELAVATRARQLHPTLAKGQKGTETQQQRELSDWIRSQVWTRKARPAEKHTCMLGCHDTAVERVVILANLNHTQNMQRYRSMLALYSIGSCQHSALVWECLQEVRDA